MNAEVSAYNFSRLFQETKGGPVTYNGLNLVMLDRFPAKPNEKLIVTIESTSSKYPQGVGVSEEVEVFGQKVKQAVVWEYFSLPPGKRSEVRSQLPYSFEVVCRNKKEHLSFYNMAELDGRHEWWTHASAMIVEEIPNGRRYRCNDFQPNDDFNDIVFRVERKAD